MENKFNNESCNEIKVNVCKFPNLPQTCLNQEGSTEPQDQHPINSELPSSALIDSNVTSTASSSSSDQDSSSSSNPTFTVKEGQDDKKCSETNDSEKKVAELRLDSSKQSSISCQSSNETFNSLDALLDYLQNKCDQSKGYEYAAELNGTSHPSKRNAARSSYRISCKNNATCPFVIQVCFDIGTKKYQIINDSNALWIHKHEEIKPTTEKLVKSEPFRKRISSTQHPFSAIGSGAPTQVLMYSSVVDSALYPNILCPGIDESDIADHSHSSLESPPSLSHLSSYSGGGGDAAGNNSFDEAINISLKKRVKEIKQTFKRIHDSKKVACAEEVLRLLRTRCREFPAFPDDSKGTSGAGSYATNDSRILGIKGEPNSDDEDGNFELPSFTISERKRKQVGTYRCRICRKEGHNSRSCEVARGPLQSLILNSDRLTERTNGTSKKGSLISPDFDSVSVVVGNSTTPASTVSVGGQSNEMILGDSLSFDNELLHDPLLLRQSHSIDSEMIYVNDSNQ